MSTLKEVKPEEIALGFLVSTLAQQRKPTTRLGLSKYSLSAYLSSALRKGVLQENVDPATGIKCYCASPEFLSQFSQTRAAAMMRHLKAQQAAKQVEEEETKKSTQPLKRREQYDDRTDRGNSYGGT